MRVQISVLKKVATQQNKPIEHTVQLSQYISSNMRQQAVIWHLSGTFQAAVTNLSLDDRQSYIYISIVEVANILCQTKEMIFIQ